MNVFAHLGIEELQVYRTRLLNRIVNGSQTRVAIAAGMADEWTGKTEAELRALMREVNEQLHELDPDVYPDPNATDRPGVTRFNFNTC